jgi:hypothetical protein
MADPLLPRINKPCIAEAHILHDPGQRFFANLDNCVNM